MLLNKFECWVEHWSAVGLTYALYLEARDLKRSADKFSNAAVFRKQVPPSNARAELLNITLLAPDQHAAVSGDKKI